ncbi:MAG: aldehyde dehydrogenase EutE [Cutibacterium avidum]|mgnify:FL=1|uniref:Aldehyde dehydrogenase EutE n=1 Tax=Cutibacterium avidum TaxID=33010 RepID=A0A3E2DDB2_9ACTN|nr:aldehyde dehydrogenase family protein [Cutibacterium avidum]MDU2071757.1 aldehyde dehydrogenase EutE [Cutibacterium avidum]MDU3219118.1 aldehyde dehydrogenase EutE [Cutibacterium avidum]MDU3283090.1 aldehyde dehydrogenase EutE [Cutibacterium avidum]MDU3567637.1 aldehyde dehydrogenase EutE [Cutibacterium avidum]MDU5868727.1 aldehyde dehydrogenase EutE [Cutibacterium avidum]
MTITAERPVTEPSVEDLAGVFNDVNSAVGAARRAFVAFSECSLAQRRAFVDAVREAATQQDRLEYMASAAVEETRMGNAHHKVLKNRYAATRTPGVEDLVMEAHQGDDGLTTLEYSPYGVIGAVTPTTNPTETIICNTIGMLSAGNTVVFSPHPRARHLSAWLVDVLNRAMMATGAPANLITLIANPTPKTTKKLISHPDITMLVATGGPQIVNMVLSSGKKAIGAGSGNPPVVVDETANIAKAAADIVQGASFDNNLPCTAEKEMIVVASVLPEFMAALQANGAQVISDREDLVKLRSLLLDPSGTKPNTAWVGQDAQKILRAAGIEPEQDTRLITMITDPLDPFVQVEMLMPVVPVVPATDYLAAIDLAVELEHGNRHTAIMHSKDVSRLDLMARRIQTTIFVKNGPSFAGIGINGEGFATFTIAGPTGEGLTSARSFARRRRCVLDAH